MGQKNHKRLCGQWDDDTLTEEVRSSGVFFKMVNIVLEI